ELIEYLRNKDLKLTETQFEIIRKEEITSLVDLKEAQQYQYPKTNTRLVSVFVDNFNLFIEGKYFVGRLEEADAYDHQRGSYQLNQFYIDHEHLVSIAQKGRQMGTNPVIVDSHPTSNDSLWERICQQDFHVKVYDRNIANQEKMELGAFVGDDPILERALDYNWKVEVWFWSSGMSADLEKRSLFTTWMTFYRHFSYAYGQDPTEKTISLK
ncbi:8570_t:CDS:2, partial [Gigaspora rosea]